jgi:SAM-dependent methyltransferase
MKGEPSSLGTIFDEDAGLYDAMRPTYPGPLFDDLANVAELAPGSSVLEIGAGTAQATIPLAEHGFRVIALEPGPDMAALARRKLQRFPLVTVEVSTFEAWPLSPEPFDAVVAATAFHWVDPEVRVPKAAQALRRGGTLAILSTTHVAGGNEDFFRDVQACYERFEPSTPPDLKLPREEDVSPSTEEIDRSAMFGPTWTRRLGWERTYSADEYQRLLLTYSGHRALQPQARQGLLDCIAQLISTRFDGKITKRYLFELVMAPKLSSRS